MIRRDVTIRQVEELLLRAHQQRPRVEMSENWMKEVMQQVRLRAPVHRARSILFLPVRFAWRFAASSALLSCATCLYAFFSWGGLDAAVVHLALLDGDLLAVLFAISGLPS